MLATGSTQIRVLTYVEAHVLGVDPLGHDLPLNEGPHLGCLIAKPEKIYWLKGESSKV